ncbi:hypothetical protein BT63DRAFT_414366 [Microthyrium microscopicum]|uniref:Glycosyltransferase family 69 protein n=1 Tax=Microthyrium microscopicum TaxID=703497 RepID=A0A6A6U9S4_9PEZI|nr:hypothetical protein BT63DRAFT_414366 [Microthyrium microscopicum]
MDTHRSLGMEEANTHLLARISSEDSRISSSESFSDYHDDVPESYFYEKPHRSPKSRFGRFLSNLTYSPLGIWKRRKTKSKKLRIFSCIFNLVVLGFIICLLWVLGNGVLRPSYSNFPQRYQELAALATSSNIPGRGNPRGEKVFIASNIIQHELIRGPWGASVLELIDMLGPDNVFVSIYENDSGPETVQALQWFQQQLNCEHSIVTGDHLPLSDFPTVIIPKGEPRVQRLTYLAEVRNRLLVPLDNPPVLESGHTPSVNYTSTRFDRVLFINDIYFNPEDALNLLFSTNQNPTTGIAEYQGACALDFLRGGTLYDSFVIRDTDGYEISTSLYPFFTARGSATSRDAVLAQSDTVPVRSCWSGMAAYEATPFLQRAIVDAHPPSILTQNTMPNTTQIEQPLRFRHEPEIFWDASECCLLNADLLARTPDSPKMFVNPYIRVAYDLSTWRWQPRFQRFERAYTPLQWFAEWFPAGWEHNPRRTQNPRETVTVQTWTYENSALNGEHNRNASMDAENGLSWPMPEEQMAGHWQKVEKVARGDGYCGKRGLMVMLTDLQKANRDGGGRNWELVKAPKGL